MKPCILCGAMHEPLHTIKIQTIINPLHKTNDAEGNICVLCWQELMCDVIIERRDKNV